MRNAHQASRRAGSALRRFVLRILGLVVLPTIALVVAVVFAPERKELAIHIWLLVLLGILSLALLRATRLAHPTPPSPFTESLRTRSATIDRPSALLRLEREVSMAGSASFDVHFRLRPALVELVEELLSSRRGIDFRREPERAHAVLGDDAWELVRPDRPEPKQRLSAGIDPVILDRVISSLESV